MAGTEGLNPFGVKDQKVTYSPSLGKTRETLHMHREVPWEPKREDATPKYATPSPAPPEDSALESGLGKRSTYKPGRILGQGGCGQQSKIIGQTKVNKALEESARIKIAFLLHSSSLGACPYPFLSRCVSLPCFCLQLFLCALFPLCCVSNNKFCTYFYSLCLLETFLRSKEGKSQGNV